MRCRPLVLASVVAVAALSLLAAGCGGGSPEVASVASSTAATATAAAPAAATTAQNGALAFARCMRSHGLTGWPDPTSNGVFEKSRLEQLGYSVSRVRALEEGACNHLLAAPAAAPPVTLADQADYLKAAACMRSQGFPGFPDPTFQNDSVQTNIPPSIDQDSSRFRGAAETCTRLIPAGLPYSSASAHR
jgi:hypothetical protein